MSGFSFVPPACPCDAVFSTFTPRFTARSRHWDATFLHVFSTVSCPFQADVCSNLPLLRPTLSISTCHCWSSSALTALSARTLTATLLASTHFAPSVLQGITHTSFYTNQPSHQPAFTQTHFYTNSLFHIPHTSFYADQLFDQPAFTQTIFCTNFYKPAFTQINCCTNHLLHQLAFTTQLLYAPLVGKPTFYTNQLYTTIALGL